jgi:uncharacterized membrane protein YkoI
MRQTACDSRDRAQGEAMRIRSELCRSLRLAAVLVGALGPLVALPGWAADHQQHQPRIPLADARTKALALVPGTVVAEELEHERGRWIYSFEIKPQGEKRRLIKEVNVDADTGVIVNVETEKE